MILMVFMKDKKVFFDLKNSRILKVQFEASSKNNLECISTKLT